jgi:uncharacterized protein (TIGR03067 family)
MRNRLSLLLAVLLFAAMSVQAQEQTASDAKDLQGVWQIIDLEANAEKKPAEEFQGTRVFVKGNELWAVKPTGADPKLKFTVDPQKNPKTIDLTVQEGNDKGKVVLGIYSVKDGQLRLCINIFGDASYRPTEFKTRDRDGVAFATLEREKSK